MVTKLAQIRPGRRNDAAKLSDVYTEVWRSAYQGIIPHLTLERMIAKRGAPWWDAALSRASFLLVLEFDGEPAGYATYGHSRPGRHPFQGEIFELYVQPAYQGIGFGGRLFTEARQRLAERHLRGLIVWSLADNDIACNFYRGLGGKPVTQSFERFGDVALRKIGFAWR